LRLNGQHSVSAQLIKLHENKRLPVVGCRPVDGSLIEAWFELNYRLQEEAIDSRLSKRFIEQWIMRLWPLVSPWPECFWLFLARITELALLCASRYVDWCEFSAADELLVEPTCVLLPSEGTRTGASQGRTRRMRPMLPCLHDLLKGSGCMTDEYLLSISRRTEQIVHVLKMLLALGMGNTKDISMKLSLMDPAQRGDFRARLCLFDRKTFNEIGRALHLFMQSRNVHDGCVSKYLRAGSEDEYGRSDIVQS